MASPSQIPTSQDIATEQIPSTTTVFTHPDPVSPHQSDSIDALFNTEKADVLEDSLTSKRGKQGREGDGVTDDTPRAQRHCSTRNPQIGSGFNNQPEDLVVIHDGVDMAKVGGGDGGDEGSISLVGVQTGSFASFHDRRIVPDSVCTLDTLAKLREEYRILDYITLSLPHRGYDVYTLPQDRLLIHRAAFECGVRLPLHPTFHRALVALELTPIQISPGF